MTAIRPDSPVTAVTEGRVADGPNPGCEPAPTALQPFGSGLRTSVPDLFGAGPPMMTPNP